MQSHARCTCLVVCAEGVWGRLAVLPVMSHTFRSAVRFTLTVARCRRGHSMTCDEFWKRCVCVCVCQIRGPQPARLCSVRTVSTLWWHECLLVRYSIARHCKPVVKSSPSTKGLEPTRLSVKDPRPLNHRSHASSRPPLSRVRETMIVRKREFVLLRVTFQDYLNVLFKLFNLLGKAFSLLSSETPMFSGLWARMS